MTKKAKIRATQAKITTMVNNIAKDISNQSLNCSTAWLPAVVFGPLITNIHANTPIPERTNFTILSSNAVFFGSIIFLLVDYYLIALFFNKISINEIEAFSISFTKSSILAVI